jgi:hypothetical protein
MSRKRPIIGYGWGPKIAVAMVDSAMKEKLIMRIALRGCCRAIQSPMIMRSIINAVTQHVFDRHIWSRLLMPKTSGAGEQGTNRATKHIARKGTPIRESISTSGHTTRDGRAEHAYDFQGNDSAIENSVTSEAIRCSDSGRYYQ